MDSSFVFWSLLVGFLVFFYFTDNRLKKLEQAGGKNNSFDEGSWQVMISFERALLANKSFCKTAKLTPIELSEDFRKWGKKDFDRYKEYRPKASVRLAYVRSEDTYIANGDFIVRNNPFKEVFYYGEIISLDFYFALRTETEGGQEVIAGYFIDDLGGSNKKRPELLFKFPAKRGKLYNKEVAKDFGFDIEENELGPFEDRFGETQMPTHTSYKINGVTIYLS